MPDIFISYAHIDNEPFGEEHSRWVTEFAENLRKRLGMVAGEAAELWRDPRLQGNDAIWPTIEGALAEALALVSVISPRYVKSDSCLREIELFVQKWRERGVPPPGPRKPLFKVVKTHVPRDQHPDVLRDVNGYEFYEEDKAAHRYREFGLHPDPKVNRLYWTRIDDLAQDIGAILEDIQPAATPAGEPVLVYVAQTTRDVREARDAIVRELKDRGVEVLPVGDLPSAADELMTLVRADLGRAQFSVHIVGARDGFVPEGETRSVVELQYVLAQEARTPGLLWSPSGPEPAATPGTAAAPGALAGRLAASAIPENGFYFLRGTLGEVKALLLTRLAEPPRPAQPVASADAFTVYLVYLRKAVARVQALEADLQQLWPAAATAGRFPLRFTTPIDRGTPAQLRTDHEAKLRVSDAVVVVCADAPPDWVAAKLTELKRAGLASESAPRAFFYLPPSGDAAGRFPVAGSVDELLTLLAGVRPR
jgi:hypothetical protein